MKGSFLHALLGSHSKRQDAGLNYNAAPPNLSTLANGTLFETWRPKAHVLPPRYADMNLHSCSRLRLSLTVLSVL